MANSLPLSNSAHDKLKEMILNNEFPPGAHLDEKQLCDLLGISRTPLREAMNRLVYEQLLVAIPQKGMYVPEMSVQTISELFLARKMLEPMIILLSAPNLERDVLLSFREKTVELIDRVDVPAIHRLDYEFHDYINGRCGNQYILKAVSDIGDHFQRVRTQNFYPQERALNGAHEHIEIIDSTLNKNFDVLPELMLKHITSTESFYFKSLQKNDIATANINNILRTNYFNQE